MKAGWTTGFDPFHTWPSEFQSTNGGMMCQMMHQKGNFECAYMQDFRAVRVPCGPPATAQSAGKDVSITFVLPNFDSIDDAVELFTAERWQALCKTMVKEDVKLYVPRFKVENANCLIKGELESCGVRDLFHDTRCDLSRV